MNTTEGIEAREVTWQRSRGRRYRGGSLVCIRVCTEAPDVIWVIFYFVPFS